MILNKDAEAVVTDGIAHVLERKGPVQADIREGTPSKAWAPSLYPTTVKEQERHWKVRSEWLI